MDSERASALGRREVGGASRPGLLLLEEEDMVLGLMVVYWNDLRTVVLRWMVNGRVDDMEIKTLKCDAEVCFIDIDFCLCVFHNGISQLPKWEMQIPMTKWC